MKKQKFHIETLGCKVNQYESDGIAASLEGKGLIRGEKNQAADLFIINTCAVTSKAGSQSRQAIRKIIRDNPGAKIIVTGCHAQTDPGLIQKIDHVDHIVCHNDKTQIANLVAHWNSCQDLDQTPEPNLNQDPFPLGFSPPDHSRNNQFLRFEAPVRGNMTRAYLKIQDGCNAFCTYCIVPYARGSSVSMPPSEVMKHLEGLALSGFKEVILTGIHTGIYGQDLSPVTTLLGLVETIDRHRPVARIRISSIEPNEISDGLIDLAGPDHILCDHFHIPLQSGDDEILKKMKRPYTAGYFEEMILKLHGKLPFAGIGVDILVGFPGETDRQFDNTLDLIQRLPLSYLHVFPFSARKGTPAYHFGNRVAPEKIKQRCARLRTLDTEKRLAFVQANQGRNLQGLVQQTTDKPSGLLKAITANYLTLLIAGDNALKGKILDLTYEQCDSRSNLIGKILNPCERRV